MVVMRTLLVLVSVCQTAALQSLVLRHHMSPARPRLLSPRAQQGPLEDGFKGLMPLADNSEGNVEPELVARVQQEVRDLMGVELEDLLNPSKVVNLEREKIVKEAELASCTDAEVRGELETRLEKIEGDLFREKRTVFQGWLKGLFISQSVISLVLSGYMVRQEAHPATALPHHHTTPSPSHHHRTALIANSPPPPHRAPPQVFDAFPTVTIDISLRALGFWSFWLFIIPSLRARRPRGGPARPKCPCAQQPTRPTTAPEPHPPAGPERGGLAAWMPWRGSGGALMSLPLSVQAWRSVRSTGRSSARRC